MKADEIMQVLRLTAMGRVNTPMQQEFANKLEALFASGMDLLPGMSEEEAKALNGGPSHPAIEKLAEELLSLPNPAGSLSSLLAEPEPRRRVPLAEALELDDPTSVTVTLDGPIFKADSEWTQPKRRKKAE